MSCDFYQLAAAGVQGLTPYVPGKPVEELQRELGIEQVVKLASNENPLGMSQAAVAAIQEAVAEGCRYPDGSGTRLKRKLADKLGVAEQQLTLGNGSNDVLELIARAFLVPGAASVFSQHAFAVYPIVTQAIGADSIQVPARNWGHDLDAMAASITEQTRVVFLANPNNPTGTWFDRTALVNFLQQVPESVIVVLDEAYTEYVDHPDFPDGLALLPQFANLVVTRTFSKAYGLASLRVGYGVSNPQIADLLNRVRQPFNVNSFALAAATAVLDDADYLAQSCELNRRGMQQLVDGFASLGLAPIPSVGNFISVDVGREALPVYQALLHEGVIVRPVASYGMPRHLRVSIGLEQENQQCLEALAKVLSA